MLARTDVIVVGAGPAGLATSRSLSLRGIEHVVLERGEVGERWHSERWPGLTLLTPNWMNGLPGLTPDGAVDGFMPAAAFAAFLDRYRAEIVAPVVTGCAVHSVTASGSGFRVRASRGAWECRAVVVATGACDRATVPAWSGDLPGRLHQITPGRYRGPGDLPAGRVLVVGASATGVQIASDLRAAGREVVLSVGRHVRAPRRYRGRDLFHWLHRSGFLCEPRARGGARPVALPSLQLVGHPDHREIGLATLAAEGVAIAGRAIGTDGGRIRFAPSLTMECAAAEVRRRKLLAVADRHIEMTGLSVPTEDEAWEARVPPVAAFAGDGIASGEIGAVIWATGYFRAYPWLRVPALDGAGEIISDGGHTPVAGLFTLGLPFMRHRSSAFIHGLGRDAGAVAAAVADHLDAAATRVA